MKPNDNPFKLYDIKAEAYKRGHMDALYTTSERIVRLAREMIDVLHDTHYLSYLCENPDCIDKSNLLIKLNNIIKEYKRD